MSDKSIQKHIYALLNDKQLSGYQIGKGSGVSIPTVLMLRNHKRKVDRLQLKTAEKLDDYYYRSVQKSH